MMAARLLASINTFQVDSADFDGTNDYMTRGAALTGLSNSKLGLLSAWVRLDGGDGVETTIYASDAGGESAFKHRFYKSSGNDFSISGVQAGSDTTVMVIETTTAYTASATWLHVMASWDTSDTGKRHIYVNDVSDLTAVFYNDAAIGYADTTNWAIGARTDGNNKFDGCIAELYFFPGVYMDLSVEANRRKFISSTGKPVFLGTDGSAPTGTAPIVYQRVANGAAASTFATNLGSGGDFSITGTLTVGSTSPSD